MSLPALRDLLDQHFNDAELRQLTFDLGIEYENLPGEKTRIGKAQSLIKHCLRHGRLPDLTTHCQILRPKVTWPDGAALAAEWQTVQQGIADQEKLQGIIAAEQLTAVLTALKQKEVEILAQLLGKSDKSAPDLTARQAYLAWLMSERKTLPLRAISAGKAGSGAGAPELAHVYVALNTTSQVKKKGKREIGEAEQEPLSALQAVATNQRVILLGDPGSGKSTFVTHLAYCLAAQALYPNENWLSHLPGWPAAKADLLPVLIVLRDFARWLPTPLPPKAHVHHLWDFVAETLRKEKLEGALPILEQALGEGRVLLLLDGLDEVTDVAQRRFVRDAVQAVAVRYKDSPLLVTCRIHSYQPPDREKEEEDLRLPAATFPDFQLAEFNGEQRDVFIHAWYGELKRQGHLPGLDVSLLSRDLQQAVRRSDLRRVAGNPLLLTVMAMVHVEDGRLPDSRALLYNKTVDLLLSRWEETKGENEAPRLRQLLQEAGRTDVDLKARLAEVAFQVHTQAGTSTDEEQVSDIGEAYLCQELGRLHKKDLGWGQELLAVIKTRAGLLIERSPGQFAFPHRTFQEYLAGVFLSAQPDFAARALAWARQDVGWWPMVLFAVEHLVYVNERPLDPLPFISKLCPEQVDETAAGWRQAWLAGEALVSLGIARAGDSEWGQTLLERVQQRLVQLIEGEQLPPRERAAAGRALAQLGDPRPGVGVVVRDGVQLPDIAWGGEVPAGTYTIGGDKQAFQSFDKQEITIKYPYRLSRYPITYAQFQCFVEAADFGDGRWWADMPEIAQDWQGNKYPVREIAEQRFPYASHPREMVSWYQAVAFCRWLSHKLGITVQLPHEYEWEAAARYPHGRAYPWGDDFDSDKANTHESGIGQTTAVGLYPSGRNVALDLYDLSGNVWEWCRNKFQNPDKEAVDQSSGWRVWRGGSWINLADDARAACRFNFDPGNRNLDVGFRVVVVRPPSQ
ncbi:MAG TPA: SUMF1/EgtB/PvdO family nonheme iron enzyme [Chloroflexota bacterium]|nr:SUMF1/EgtB/PvdO family nonheme iron enzyme [Chloroflexota bacterium]